MQSQKDIDSIKSKIIEQINSQYPKDQAKEFSDKIMKMGNEEFIEFLKQQGLIKEDGKKSEENCIFCAIASKQIPSTKLAENEKAIAVLELNPVSLGHTIIIPKEHITKEEEIPKEAKELSKIISNLIENAFHPKRIDKVNSELMGHYVINLIPIYKDESINSKREKKSPEELNKIKEQIENSAPKKIEKKETQENEPKKEEKTPEEINEKNTWLPKRIP